MKLVPENFTAQEVIQVLGLQPLPLEGGYFRRTLSSPPALSAIHYLLTPDSGSALHRLKADEIWSFQAGDPLELLRLHADGSGDWTKLGVDPGQGQQQQALVSRDTWQGARLTHGGKWALISCVVVPAFFPEQFELGDASILSSAYPTFCEDIKSLTLHR